MSPLDDSQKMVPSSTMDPVTMTVIGTGTGNGGTPLTTGTIAQTPGHMPNIAIRVITPLVAITVRFSYAFMIALSGLISAAQTPAGAKMLHATDFGMLVKDCASLSFVIACAGLIKDLVTVLSNLEKKYPLATGSV